MAVASHLSSMLTIIQDTLEHILQHVTSKDTVDFHLLHYEPKSILHLTVYHKAWESKTRSVSLYFVGNQSLYLVITLVLLWDVLYLNHK